MKLLGEKDFFYYFTGMIQCEGDIFYVDGKYRKYVRYFLLFTFYYCFIIGNFRWLKYESNFIRSCKVLSLHIN